MAEHHPPGGKLRRRHRRLSIWTFLALCSATLCLAGQVRTLVDERAITPTETLDIGLPFGALLVDAVEGDVVTATLTVECDDSSEKCEARAARVQLIFGEGKNRLKVQTDGVTRASAAGLSIRLRVTVPASQGLEVDLGAGDVSIRGLIGKVEVDVGVGDVEITLPQSELQWVKMDTGIGTSRLLTDLGEVRGSGVVRSGLVWSQGRGSALIEIDTGIGDILVDAQ